MLTLVILQFSHSPTARQPGFAMVPEAQLEFWSSPCDVRAWCPWIARSKRVQVREQIGHLLLIEDLRISRHHIPAITDNVTNLLIIRGQSALGQKLPLEDPFHARPFFSACRVCGMAALAVLIENVATGSLLWVETELRVCLAEFHITGDQQERDRRKGTEAEVCSSNFRLPIGR